VKEHVYHLEFHGSFSLKAVLPALVQGFSYEGMEVSHGGEAGMVWDHMVRGNSSPEEKETPEGCTARLLQAGHAGDGQSA
jgi:hypothetical protein